MRAVPASLLPDPALGASLDRPGRSRVGPRDGRRPARRMAQSQRTHLGPKEQTAADPGLRLGVRCITVSLRHPPLEPKGTNGKRNACGAF